LKTLRLLVALLFNLLLFACQINLKTIPTLALTTSLTMPHGLNFDHTSSPTPTPEPFLTNTRSLTETLSLLAAIFRPRGGPERTLTKPPDVPLPSPTPAPPRGGQITIGVVGKLTSLNPLTDLSKTLALLRPLLYEPLNQLDPMTAQPVPNQADLVTLSADGLTLTYTLRTASLDPADLKASIETAIWPGLAKIRSVTETGSKRVTIRLTEPDCVLVDQLAQLPILTQTTASDPIPLGSGPFQLETWDAENNILRFIPNERQGVTKPWLEAITVRFFDENTSAWHALQAGELDLLPIQTSPDDLPPGYYSLAYPAPLQTFISFNHKHEIMQVPEVRQALSLAVNRAGLLTIVLDGQGELMASSLHPEHWATDLTLSPPAYDPDQAVALLDEAGLTDRDGDGWRDEPDGDPWALGIRVYGDDEMQTAVAFLVADAYRQLGIRARAELVPQFTILDDLLNYEYQAAVYGFLVLPELNQRPYWHSDQIGADFGLNVAAYANLQVDDWLDEANQLPGCNAAERAILYHQIQQQLDEDRPVDFLMVPHQFLIIRDELQGLAPGPFASFTWNVADWYLE